MMIALNQAGFDVCDSTHKIVLVGDAFDRGDESYKVLTFLKEYVKQILNNVAQLELYGIICVTNILNCFTYKGGQYG